MRLIQWQKNIILLLVLLLAGCSSELTHTQFEKIENNMTMEQVVNIIGKPTETVSFSVGVMSGTTATWKKDNVQIVIQFINNKVTIKNFIKDGRQKH